jgi:pimeloyl-ACP methyl ester carboxylesterase
MTMDFQLQHAQLSSGPISYRVGGEGRPLVHFHSSGGIRTSEMLQSLSRNHKTFLPIVPGFDGTPLPLGDGSMRGLAAIMAEFIEAELGGTADVMGQSFGGWLALWLAVERPDLVEQLVIMCPAGFRPEGWGGLPQDPADLRRTLHAYPERAPAEERSPEMVLANRPIPGHYHGNRAFDHELCERLTGITARTLILQGTRDEVVPAQSVVVLKERIPHSHLTYVYDAGHALDVDQPARTLRIVRAFLERGAAFLVRTTETAA